MLSPDQARQLRLEAEQALRQTRGWGVGVGILCVSERGVPGGISPLVQGPPGGLSVHFPPVESGRMPHRASAAGSLCPQARKPSIISVDCNRQPVPTRCPQPLSQGLWPCQLPLHRGAQPRVCRGASFCPAGPGKKKSLPMAGLSFIPPAAWDGSWRRASPATAPPAPGGNTG